MRNGVSRKRFGAAFLVTCALVCSGQTWIQLMPTGDLPPRAIGPAVAYNPTSNRLILFGGGDTGGIDPQPATAAVRILTNANGFGGAPVWSQLVVTGGPPPARRAHATTYDVANNRLIVFGGGATDHIPVPSYNDTWVLTNADGTGGPSQWIQLLPSGSLPPPRQAFGAVYDSSSNRLIIFGGFQWEPRVFYNDVWVLANANGLGGAPQWIQLAPSGVTPGPRASFGTTYDTATNRLTIVGGFLNAAYDSDPENKEVWVLENANGLGGSLQWQKLTPSPVLSRYGLTPVYDGGTNRLTYFSGATPGVGGYSMSDTFVLTNANGLGGAHAWSTLNASGTRPLGREGYAAAYDPLRNRMIIFGGWNGLQLNDVWVLTDANGVVSSTLRLDQVLPATGGNAGLVTVRILGAGFEPDSEVRLTGLGSAILATSVTASPNRSSLDATFDLRGAVPGIRDLRVSSPSTAEAITLQAAFTVQLGGATKITLDVLGRTVIRIGGKQVYYFVVTNSGNIDSSPSLMAINHPSAVRITPLESLLSPPDPTSSIYFGSIRAPLSLAALEARSVSAGLQVRVIDGPANPGGAGGSERRATGTELTLQLAALSRIPPQSTTLVPVEVELPADSGIGDFILGGLMDSSSLEPDLTDLPLDTYLARGGCPYREYDSRCTECVSPFLTMFDIYDRQLVDMYFQAAHAQIDGHTALLEVAADVTLALSTGFMAKGVISAFKSAFFLGLPTAAEVGAAEIALDFAIESLRTSLRNLDAERSGQQHFENARDSFLEFSLRWETLKIYAESRSFLWGRVFSVGSRAVFTALQKLQLISGASTWVDARNAELEARARFFAGLRAYCNARIEYEQCLQSRCSITTESAPPPNAASGETSIGIVGVASLDPNDKIGRGGTLGQRFVTGEGPLDYLISFENYSTATAPAQRVIVEDEVDVNKFDLRTFSFRPISVGTRAVMPPEHTMEFIDKIDLRPENNVLVGVSAKFNKMTGVIRWQFETIDPETGLPVSDPLGGFLPPNRMPPEGQGSVGFTLLPHALLETGAEIRNTSSIVFDDNPPIVTPEWLNTIDRSQPTSRVLSMPSTVSTLMFPVAWSGDDTGSGIRDYSVFVSDNGGPFRQWLARTPATTADFVGLGGHAYSFFSVARDYAGNSEGPKSAAEASTAVNVPCAVDSTSSFAVVRSGLRYNNSTRRYVQMVTLRNSSGAAIAAPISLALDGLSSNAALHNLAGLTTCETPTNSPFVHGLGSAPKIQPNAVVNVNLEFVNPSNQGINYKTRILTGSGIR